MLRILRLFVILLFCSSLALAVTMPELDALIESSQFVQAERVIQDLLKQNPGDPEVLQRLGFLRIRQAADQKDEVQAKELRRQAREILLQAQASGNTNELVALLLDSIPPDGGEPQKYSSNEQVHSLMEKAEEWFRKGEYAKAVVLYKRAEELEPTLYHAALYQGDSYLQLGLVSQACASYRRATEISPNTETAYRYWGNALMRRGEVEQALVQYCHAVVADPGSRMAWKRGLQVWVQTTGSQIAMPQVRPKTSVSENGQEIVILSNSSPETLSPWLAYASVRILWRTKLFSERHPGTPYERTLAEEVEALSAAVEQYTAQKVQNKDISDEDLELLSDIARESLLEPFVLFTGAEGKFMGEFAQYREKHRDKLVRFLVEHVIQRESL